MPILSQPTTLQRFVRAQAGPDRPADPVTTRCRRPIFSRLPPMHAAIACDCQQGHQAVRHAVVGRSQHMSVIPSARERVGALRSRIRIPQSCNNSLTISRRENGSCLKRLA